MFRFVLASTLAAAGADDHPHLSQAWQAISVGDGQPGKTGLESYIYEDCNKRYNETCMRGHVFDYGADTCVKYEVDMGTHSQYTGTFYVKCQAVNCCKAPKTERPNPKQWDIGLAASSVVTHVGATDIQDLDGDVAGADTWNEIFQLPFGGVSVNYTYYITQSGDDVISHRIDYSAPGDTDVQAGSILYGNFVAKHPDELDAFREVFKAPAECLKSNTLICKHDDMEEWDRKFFQRHAVAREPTPAVV